MPRKPKGRSVEQLLECADLVDLLIAELNARGLNRRKRSAQPSSSKPRKGSANQSDQEKSRTRLEDPTSPALESGGADPPA